MKNSLHLFRVTLVLLASTLGNAAPVPSSKDPDAIAFLAHALQAHGGKPVTSGLKLRGSVFNSTDGTQIGTFVIFVRDDDFAFTGTLDGKNVAIVSLKRQVSARQDGNTRHLPNASDFTVDIVPQLTSWTRFSEPNASIHPRVIVQRDGIPMAEITVEVVPPDGAVNRNRRNKQTVVINPATGLIHSLSYRVSGVAITNTYLEYQSFQGLFLPKKIMKTLGGQPALLYVIEEAMPHLSVSDADLMGAFQ